MDKPIYAVWKYDSYPYLLVGEVEADLKTGQLMSDTGMVHIKGYGTYSFKPIKILSEVQGKSLLQQLKELSSRRAEGIQAVQDILLKELNIVREQFELPQIKKGAELA